MDGPSRRPDYEICNDNIMVRFLATLAVTTITESYGDLLPEIKAAQKSDLLATKIQLTMVDDLIPDESQWRSIKGALIYERSIYVPPALHIRVTGLLHDNPKSDHFRALMTAEMLPRYLYWPEMESGIRKYVARCELCPRIKALCHAGYILNMPLSPPCGTCEGLTMDFVTDLPE